MFYKHVYSKAAYFYTGRTWKNKVSVCTAILLCSLLTRFKKQFKQFKKTFKANCTV